MTPLQSSEPTPAAPELHRDLSGCRRGAGKHIKKDIKKKDLKSSIIATSATSAISEQNAAKEVFAICPG